MCHCGEPPLRISNIPLSMGRQFYECARFLSITKCKFFEWIDPPACDCRRDKQLQNHNIEKAKNSTP
ncbi:hypothetical protein RHGRI_001861 [Rhododendron griersonianum]|uniref:GRF-type domain-containing protein n=1 Tax=Rhododendron griersonianum TaxID=479676 RepID=A0AAV6LPY3_9ERIC|nr:hypothetical protein RHGRI_001861 [Rhododendron griersonianum]